MSATRVFDLIRYQLLLAFFTDIDFLCDLFIYLFLTQ